LFNSIGGELFSVTGTRYFRIPKFLLEGDIFLVDRRDFCTSSLKLFLQLIDGELELLQGGHDDYWRGHPSSFRSFVDKYSLNITRCVEREVLVANKGQ
jgi:hypothetical protein